jgi:endonuclease G
MLIRSELVSDSIRRAQRSRVHPAELARSQPEEERKRRATPEQRRQRWSTFLAQTGNAETAETMLERLMGANDLVGINYLELGTLCARSVCRIRLRDTGGATVGFGTGFLVAPGILMTNHHVISSAEQARLAQAEFDYELDVRGNDKRVARFAILNTPAPIPLKDLDFCVVAVSGRETDGGRTLDEFGWLPLNGAPGKAVVGEYLTIIQHPGGERKQVCVRENKLLKFDEGGNTLWYMTDTVAGSSGSPVFNQSWQVVALHHSGIPKTDAQGRWLTVDGKLWDPSMDESRVAWLANEGMRISRILEYLRSTHAEDPLAKVVLQHANTPVVTPLTPEKAPSTMSPEIRDGQLRLTIPVQVSLSLGGLGLPGPAVASAPAIDQRSVVKDDTRQAPSAVEAVIVDQSNYAERPGYDPKFLGAGKLRVPLPVPRGGLAQQVLSAARGKPELRYWNYSVLMHRTRRLAIFSAVNVDASKRPPGAGRDGDRWYTDKRIDAKDQLGAEFYGAQREFEVDRSATPFDRGHLTRRLDAQWGDGDDATRNGNDSFHWTNCSPQHWKFNQGAKRWLGLEDYVVDGFAGKGGRACIVNGPVFDAPLSSLGEDGAVVLAPDGARHTDPTFGGVSIPKQFFKVVACTTPAGELAVAAFVMSQEDLLAQTDRIRGMPPLREEEKLTEAEARLYQVPVAAVAKLTGLDFGSLVEADTSDTREAAAVPRRIERLEDVRLETRRTPRLVRALDR